LDNSIKNRFNLGKEEFIKSVLIVKEAFSQFVTENNIHLKLIRSILTDAKFNYLRIKELSDIRIIDMYFWFKENRHKGVTTISQ